jgi:hypothetical protein
MRRRAGHSALGVRAFGVTWKTPLWIPRRGRPPVSVWVRRSSSGREDSMTLQRVIGLVQAETREVRPGRRSAGA